MTGTEILSSTCDCCWWLKELCKSKNTLSGAALSLVSSWISETLLVPISVVLATSSFAIQLCGVVHVL